jgi:hypothetical protein
MKLPIRLLGLVAAGLLIGTALAPVAAQQQQSGVDGQVAVRSDGAVYLISGGVRRWIAAVPISDDDLNAYPEGDPIYVGLGPPGAAGSTTASAPSSSSSSSSSAKPPTPTPASSPQPSASSGSSSSSSSSSSASAKPTSTPDSGVSTDIPIEVDVVDSSNNTFQEGDKISIDLKTTKDNVCELSVKWPDDTEDNEDSKTADSRGRCRFNVDVPDNMKEGAGKIKGWARTGGQYNRMDVDIQIKNKS